MQSLIHFVTEALSSLVAKLTFGVLFGSFDALGLVGALTVAAAGAVFVGLTLYADRKQSHRRFADRQLPLIRVPNVLSLTMSCVRAVFFRR